MLLQQTSLAQLVRSQVDAGTAEKSVFYFCWAEKAIGLIHALFDQMFSASQNDYSGRAFGFYQLFLTHLGESHFKDWFQADGP